MSLPWDTPAATDREEYSHTTLSTEHWTGIGMCRCRIKEEE